MDGQARFHWNITQLAEAFGVSRDTVRKRLKQANVLPVDQKRNAPLYLVADAAKAVFAPAPGVDGDYGGYDSLDKMPPKDRKDWFDSERSRVALEKEVGQLIPNSEVAEGYADFVSAIVDPLDSLTDLLERKCGLSGDVLERVQSEVDAIREQMYHRAVMSGAEQLVDDD
ncbi:hypothetical protein GZ77_09090 [Endozoicomonas montiporae]|uniref:Terminase small subunit n=2 Tax=Endozoicomonas montiporae TaxID=1027273 RepID=A0A081N7S5_9GAMM|nr:DUF1441 family protein [Endozoicomonas montiporae]AMO55640.1 hypothetical protein EZMO1_1471 [Endozoicomonas montiporae CL-33]KEQ14498.1 hypothetical protein GZ77_09090 [Endozoicomonas montiporae]